MSGVTVDTCLERIPELVSEYAIKDIWNLDDTGVFWRALPEQGFGQKGKECRGGKKVRERVTVALIANACGDKEAAVVIWKSAKPRCCKSIKIDSLPVQYYSQPNAWVTAKILESVLSKFNC